MTSAQLLALGSEAFVSLTTFRRTGIGVSTPVWIARDGDALVVRGGSVRGGATVRTEGDHRIAMSHLVLGLAAEQPVAVDEMVLERRAGVTPAPPSR